MNAPVLLAQLQGNTTPAGTSPREIKLEKPQNGAAVTVQLNGATQLDFADIASEKLTFVHVGDKLIVLFDNQSTVTIEPVFGPDGHPLADISFEMAPDHFLTGDQFASTFPITTDQSILPAAGAGGGPTAGAHFETPTVDALSTGTPLDLLGAENIGSTFTGFVPPPGNAPPTAGLLSAVVLNEDGLPGGNPGGPGDVATLATTLTASLNINFGTTGGNSLAFAAAQPGLDGLTSDGQAVHFATTTVGGLPTLICYVGNDPSILANEVFTVALDAHATASGTATVTLLRPLDHPIIGTEDTLDLSIGIIASNAAGSVSTTLHVDVNDDSPTVTLANETHSILTDTAPGSVTVATGSLGISWGADNFNDHVDGGVSATTGQTGDRSVVFSNATATTTGSESGGDHPTVISFTGLTSENQAVHYVLLDNGTALVAYTGDTPPTSTVPTSEPPPIPLDDGPHPELVTVASSNIVFVVTLTDDSSAGGYTVTQYQPLDHIAGATTFDSIDLTLHFTATDSDGDPATGTLTITVNDTVPTVTGAVIDQTVGEDGLSGNGINGVNGVVTSLTAAATLDINWGADNETDFFGGFGRSLSFLAGDGSTAISAGTTEVASLAMTITGEQGNALSSEGVALVYVVSSDGHGGETLTAYKGSSSGLVIFTLALDATAPNGGYTFTLDGPLDHATGSDSIGLAFTVQAADADGDTVNQSFVVNVQDDFPVVTGSVADGTVGEEGLAGANSIKGEAHNASTTASLNIGWGADDGSARSVVFASGTVTTLENLDLSSDGHPLSYTIDQTGTLLTASANGHTIFTVQLSNADNGSYSFTLDGNLDHPSSAIAANTIALSFDVTATDSDGDSVGQSFTVDVQDDVPVAGTGTVETVSEANLLDGSAPDIFKLGVSGNLNIAWGADNRDSGPTNNRSVSFQSTTASADVQVTDDSGNPVPALTSNGLPVQYLIFNGVLIAYTNNDPVFQQVFTVSLNDDGTGSYHFTLLSNLDHSGALNLTFAYTATDSDGDASSNAFTVTVVDDAPTAYGGDTTRVSEANLPDGTSPLIFGLHPAAVGGLHILWGADNHNLGSIANRSVTFTDLNVGLTTVDSSGHTVAVTAPLASNGVEVQYEIVNGALVGYTGSAAHPNVVFTVSLNDLGSGTYAFTLFGNLDDPTGHGTNQLNLTFDYTATDSDGSTSTNHFTVDVKDDVPTAPAVSAKTFENGSVTFGLHDNVGADNGAAAAIVLGTATVTNAPSGLTFGTPSVVLNADGTVTVTPGTAFEQLAAGQKATVTIPYTVTDSDGDTASNQISVVITGVNDAPATADHTASTLETSPYAFQLSDFAFSDVDRNSLADVVVTSLPATGSLTDHGVAVTVGQKISVADITSGAFQFTSGTGVNFASTPSFQFAVEDNGGTANGGHDTSAAATMTVDVTRVGPTGLTFTAATGAGSAGADTGISGLAAGDKIGTFAASGDPNDNDVFTYSIQSGTTTGLSLDSHSGVLSVGASATLRTVTDNFTVSVSDGIDPAFSKTVTVWVGGVHNDVVSFVGDTSDVLLAYGLGGGDTFQFTNAGFSARDYLYGGSGPDTVQLTDTTGVTVTDAAFANVFSVETLEIGGSGTNTITLGANVNADVGAVGPFWVQDLGGAGDLTVDGSAITANLNVIAGSGSNNLTGGSGDDSFNFTAASFGQAPKVNGGAGSNTIAIIDTAGYTVVDADFANVTNVQTLRLVQPGPGEFTNVTLGADASAAAGSGTFLVDAFGESAFAITSVDFTAMTAKVAFRASSWSSDTVTVTNAQFESGLSLQAQTTLPGGAGSETVVIADAADITDAAFASVRDFGTVILSDFTNSVTLGANASLDAESTSQNSLFIDGDAMKAGHDLTVDASGLDTSFSLRLDGGAGDDLFKLASAQLTSGFTGILAGGGSNTLDIVDTTSFTLTDANFHNSSGIDKLQVAPSAGAVATLTLGGNISSGVGTATFSVDASKESSTGSTVADFSAMTANFAFTGGAGNDSIAVTGAQLGAAPHIDGGGGSNTLIISDTATDLLTVADAAFANVTGIQTLKLQNGSGDSTSLTLGKDASAAVGTGTLLVDASGEGALAITKVDFTAMTANFAFIAGSWLEDTVTVTNAQFESGLSLKAQTTLPGGGGAETLVIADAATITDAAFAAVRDFGTVVLGDFNNSVTLGANASLDAESTSQNSLFIDGDAMKAGHNLTVDASGLDTTFSLRLDGGAGDDLFKLAAAQLTSGFTGILAGGGNDTLDVVDTTSFTLADVNFQNSSGIETLQVAPGAGAVATLTLGANVSSGAGTATFTVDASGESATGSTVADFHTMTAKFAFTGGAGNDTVTMTATQLGAAPHIDGGGGANTIELTNTLGVIVHDTAFANVTNFQTFKVQTGASHITTITLGADASADVGTGTLTVDTSGEDVNALTVVDFTAMTARFAFVGGSESDDNVTVTAAQFESGLSLSAAPSSGVGAESVLIASAATITDAAFASVREFRYLELENFTNSVTLGTNASLDAASTGNQFVLDNRGASAGHSLTVDATGLDTTINLTLYAGAGDDLFKLTAAQLTSGVTSVNGGAGSNTLDVVTTTGFTLTDADFVGIKSIETLQLGGAAGATDSLTLGADVSANVGTGTFTVSDTAGQENLTVDGSAMTANLTVLLGSGTDTVTGGKGVNTFTGGGGTDDFIYNVATGGTETVTGGSGPGIQTETINGISAAATYNVNPITLGTTSDVGVNILAGTTNTSAVAATATNYEVATHGVQEIVINLGNAGDNVVVNGDLSGTGLATSTLTINGGTGNDTVNLSGFTSNEDVVFDGAGNGAGGDTAIFGFASTAATYTAVVDGSGNLIGAEITYQSPDGKGAVTDTITNVEHYQFSDQTLTVGQLFPPSAPAENVAITDTAGVDAGSVIDGHALTGVTDVDSHTTLTVTAVNGVAADVGAVIAGTYGSLVLHTDGSYSYTESSGLDALAAGATGTDTFHFTVTDSNGGVTTTTLNFNATGASDTPVVNQVLATVNDTAAQDAGTVVLRGNLLTDGGIDTDRDSGATLSVTTFAGHAVTGTGLDLVGTYGTVHVNTDGSYTFTGSAALDALSAGQQAGTLDTFTVTSSNGKSASSLVDFTINGANDTPVITSAATGTEPEHTATSNVVYQIAATEADTGAHLTYSLGGTDAADFSVSSTGAVTFISSPAYHTQSTYNVNVNVFSGTLEASKAVTINVTDVAPTSSTPGNWGPPNNYVMHIEPTVFSVSVSDPDGVGLYETLSIPTDGIFTLGSTTGLTNLTGNGTGTVSFQGTLDQVNAAFSSVTFTPELGGATSALTDAFISSSDGIASSSTRVVFQIGPAGVSGEPINLALTDYSGHSDMVSLTLTGLAAGWALNEGSHNADGSWTVQGADLASLAVISPDGYTAALLLHATESWANTTGGVDTAIIADNVEAYAKGSPIFAWSGDDTLTASSGDDTLVFANRIGNDVVHGFDTAHDKIDLIAFQGMTSFADAQAHLGHDGMGNAVLTLGAGETITLTGVDAGTLTTGDFQFNQTPVTSNAGDMTIGDGATLPLSGVVDNTGSIHLGSTGSETQLEIVQHGITLQGGGTLVLSDNSANVISGSDPTVTLTNADNTISGAGQLGSGQMTLVNEGTIVADGSHALDIDTGGNAVVNTGTLEALGLGGLAVHSDLVNEAVLWANGSNLTLDGNVSGNGSALISGNGSLELGGAFGQQVAFDDNASATLKLDHSADFNGLVSGFAAHDAIDLGDILASTASLTYTANAANTGGTLSVSDGSHTANIAMSGAYAAADFSIAPDQTNHVLVQIEQHAQKLAAAA